MIGVCSEHKANYIENRRPPRPLDPADKIVLNVGGYLNSGTPRASNSAGLLGRVDEDKEMFEGVNAVPDFTEKHGSSSGHFRAHRNMQTEPASTWDMLPKPSYGASLDLDSRTGIDSCIPMGPMNMSQGHEVSVMSTVYHSGLSTFFQSIPQLLEPSSNSLNTASSSPNESGWSSLAKSSKASYLAHNSKTNITDESTLSLDIEIPSYNLLPKREKIKPHVDSSSSYYTSEITSLRSSIDLDATHIPPIPDRIAAAITSHHFVENSPTLGHPRTWGISTPRGFRTSYPGEAHLATHDNPQHSAKLGPPPTRSDSGSKTTAGGTLEANLVTGVHIKTKEVSGNASSKANTYSESGHASSIWEIGSSNKPLLSESDIDAAHAGSWDKVWLNNGDDEKRKPSLPKQRRISGGDLRHWLEEQSEGEKSKFTNGFTKRISKLRSRLSGNIKAADMSGLMTPGSAKRATRDGRGDFSRLHTSAESVTTKDSTHVDDNDDGISWEAPLNADPVPSDTRASSPTPGPNPSLPLELGSQPEYSEIEGAQADDSGPERASEDGDFKAGKKGESIASSTILGPRHRYSAIYDDCVVSPFAPEDDTTEELNTESALNTPCMA